MKRLFGTDGIRGIAGDDLSPELAMRIGQAVGWVLRKNDTAPVIFVGCDTRISSPMLVNAIICGLCSVGAAAIRLGVVPTPAVAYLTKKHRADAGIMVSASHNSYEYNGIKIFNQDGFKLADELEERIESLVSSEGEILLATHDKIGREGAGVCTNSKSKRAICLDASELAEEYLSYLRGVCSERLDGIRIAIDCANGASSYFAHALFSSLGASCHMLASCPNGTNINDGCGSTHIEHLCRYVSENKLDGGLALDGDADRLLVVNERGEVVDGDMIMASLAYDMKKRGALVKSTVVGTIMTNYGFEVFCRENDISFIPARVGDRYVLEEMLLGSYNLGGEQSGHIIFGDYSTTGDGMLTAIQLLSLMKRKGLCISTLHSVMKKYPQRLVNLEADESKKLKFLTDSEARKILESAREALGSRGRIVARPSGTERLIRIMVESEDEVKAEQIIADVASKIKKILD